MPYDQALGRRIRAALAHHVGITEKQMFGGLACFASGKMFCGIVGDQLMVRVGPEAHEGCLTMPHVRPMDFTGKPMKGYVFVAPAGVTSDEALASWVERGLAFVTGKAAAVGGRGSMATKSKASREDKASASDKSGAAAAGVAKKAAASGAKKAPAAAAVERAVVKEAKADKPAAAAPAKAPEKGAANADKGAAQGGFDEVFEALSQRVRKHTVGLDVHADSATELLMTGPVNPRDKKPLWFGGVRKGKAYVSLHLMPVYMFPDLLDGLDEAMMARMQGKSCFNFKKVEPSLMAQADRLIERSMARLRDEGLLGPQEKKARSKR